MADADAVAALKSEIAGLRAEVEDLRRAVAAAREHPGTSMRTHHRCPKCRGASFLHLSQVRDHNYGDTHTFMTIELKGVFRKRGIGRFEVYACRSCEHAEWYIVGAGEINPENLDRANREHVRIVDETLPEGGPFR